MLSPSKISNLRAFEQFLVYLNEQLDEILDGKLDDKVVIKVVIKARLTFLMQQDTIF